MKHVLRPFFVLLILISSCLAGVPDEIRQNLDKLVPEVIRLLEAKEYAAVLETLVPPDEFKKMSEQVPLAQAAEHFGKTNAEGLLKAMKALKDLKPKVSEDGTVVTYDLPEIPDFTQKTAVFKKIDGKWFLK